MARMGERRSAYRIFYGDTLGKEPLGRPRLRIPKGKNHLEYLGLGYLRGKNHLEDLGLGYLKERTTCKN